MSGNHLKLSTLVQRFFRDFGCKCDVGWVVAQFARGTATLGCADGLIRQKWHRHLKETTVAQCWCHSEVAPGDRRIPLSFFFVTLGSDSVCQWHSHSWLCARTNSPDMAEAGVPVPPKPPRKCKLSHYRRSGALA